MTIQIAVATALHLAGLTCCCWAALVAMRLQLPVGERLGWAACAGLFVGLAVVRLHGTEEFLRQTLRSQLVAAGEYDERWVVQGYLAAAILLLLLLALSLTLWRQLRQRRSTRTRLLLCAQLALLGYVPLLALRVVSWHQTDQVLYAGPVRLNWVLEALLALVPILTAYLYVRLARREHARRQPRAVR